MRRFLRLICSDLRRFCWLYGAWLAVLGCRWALAEFAGPVRPGVPGVGLFFGMDLIITVLAFSLICLLVLEHSPVRSRGPWRTRPLSRGIVVAAKLTFWLLFLALPFLTAKALTAAHFGIEGWSLLAFLGKDILLGAQISAVAFAAAALTRRFREALVAAVLIPLAAGWAFAAPILLWRSLRGISQEAVGSVIVNQSLLFGLAITLAAAGAAILLLWTRGRRRSAVAFVLCGPLLLGLLTTAYPDLATGRLLSPICRGGEYPANPIKLSLKSFHEVELPADTEFLEPAEGGRWVALNLQASSDADGVILKGGSHKARLRWPDGESRTYFGDLSGDWAFGSPVGVATGAEEIFRASPFQFQYFSADLEVAPEEMERFGELAAEFRGTLDLRAERFRVLAEIPLEKGAAWKSKGVSIKIDGVFFWGKGFQVTITESSLQPSLAGRSIERYALLNRSRGEVLRLFSSRSKEKRSTRTLWGWKQKTRISKLEVQFLEGSPVDEEWTRGAVLVAFESVCLGRSKASLHLSDFRMAEFTHEVTLAKMKEVKRRRDEEKARKAKAEEQGSEPTARSGD